MSYQYEDEDERAEGAEDDVNGDEDGEVVELGTLELAFRVPPSLFGDSQIVDEDQVRLIRREGLEMVIITLEFRFYYEKRASIFPVIPNPKGRHYE